MKFYQHPLKEGVLKILDTHFAPEIVKNFKLIFEAQSFQGENIYKQLKDEKLCLEVYYEDTDGTNYVCDIWSWMDPKQAEVALLKGITDKWKDGKIGKNWNVYGTDAKGRISISVTSGEHETPDSLIKEKMA